MYPASEAFHQAIREDKPQTPLLVFENALMTARDLCISGGLGLRRSVMDGENFTPGACIASELSVSLLNDDGRWNGFTYGEFKAYLGVMTLQDAFESDSRCVVTPAGHVISGHDSAPYLRIDGGTVDGVNAPVAALALMGEMLMVVTDDAYAVVRYADGRITHEEIPMYSPQLEFQAETLRREGMSLMFGHTGIGTGALGENNFIVWQDGYVIGYEMVPLGVFTAKRPVFSNRKLIDITGNDRMERFDVMVQEGDFATTSDQTLEGIVRDICEKMGLTFNVDQSDMLCGDVKPGWKKWTEVPDKVKDSTQRDIIQWIAEATATFGMMNRDGELVLKWFTTDPVFALTEHDYSECDVGYYRAAGIDKLVIRDNDNDKADNVTGEGENILYLTDNPFALLMR